MNQDANVLLDIKGAVATVTFNRPADRNSITQSTHTDLERVLNDLLPNPAVQVIIFTGTGDAFLSGANINELTYLNKQTAQNFSARGQQLFQRISGARQ